MWRNTDQKNSEYKHFLRSTTTAGSSKFFQISDQVTDVFSDVISDALNSSTTKFHQISLGFLVSNH